VRWRNTSRIKRLYAAGTRAQLAGYDSKDDLDEALYGIDNSWSALAKGQFVESRTFLSQYLLSSQGDRPAMAHAVEGRYPFLDYRVVEFAATIPPGLRLRGLNEKYILKKAVADLVPAEILARTKRPYRAPIRNAFLGPDAPEWVGDALSEGAVARVGIFDPRAVGMLVKKCRDSAEVGEADSMALVGVLSTQLLHRQFVQERSSMTPAKDFSPVIVGNGIEQGVAVLA